MRTYELSIKDKAYKIKVKSFNLDAAELEINGEIVKVAVKNMGDDLAGRPLPTKPVVAPRAAPQNAGTSAPKASAQKKTEGGTPVTAPIPGAIMEIFVKEGQEIRAGTPVLKMEAMKMENVINSPAEGTVISILVNPKDAVSQGQELVLIG